ncbi:hypothetical protein BT67DRAFT_314487 [Trichocladium antarcticum]|uniref:Uncharacterized protein n=1 Tax=Trichocladium antarcticum TaxID=1450529 RepID=A0AAN6UJS3_9PEZI|nr:hypothetical protein BT67DRAFT_314487 [Trichocladium antarcticum]
MPNGIASIQTTIQTTAVAAIKCHNSASPWSPYPGAPQPNPLFEIIASHWGPVSARKAMQRVARSRSIRHKSSLIPRSLSELLALSCDASWSVRGREGGGTETREEKRAVKPKQLSSEEAVPRTPMPPARTAPPIPKRKTSLRHVLDLSPTTQQQTPDYKADPKGDPTWAKLRQTPGEGPKSTTGTSYGSVASRKSYRPGRIRKASSAFYASSSPTAPVSSPPTTPVRNRKNMGSAGSASSRVGGKGDVGRQGVSRGRGAMGEGALVALTPIVVGARMNGGSPAGGKENMAYSGDIAGRNSSGKKRKEKEKEKGWGWTSWW